MNDQLFVVIVDTRAMYPSDIDGYEEHIFTEDMFNEHVLNKPRVKCVKSKVADLCGVDMRLYFHDYKRGHPRVLKDPPELAVTYEKMDLYPESLINGAATLLTFDPRTGFPEYVILGKAYVVMDCGDFPLSNHQVWGIQDLISEARDLYYCDPEHLNRGRRQLLRWCLAYREQEWGPMTIYEPRLESGVVTPIVKRVTFKDQGEAKAARQHIKEVHDYYSHRHFPNCRCGNCSQSRILQSSSSGSCTIPSANPQKRKLKKSRSGEEYAPRRRRGIFTLGGVLCNVE